MNIVKESVLKLFNAVIVDAESHQDVIYSIDKTIKYGYITAPGIKLSEVDILQINNIIGITSRQINNTFHKSWAKIKNSSMEQLFYEQIIHYITTYGFEKIGIFTHESVYIPAEKLELPDINIEDIKLKVIKGYTKEELKEKLLTLLKSGIALKEETIKYVLDIALFLGFAAEDVYQIKNKEVKIALYDYLDIIPVNNIEFLRYIIYKLTGTTLIIKDKELLDKLKSSENQVLVFKYFDIYASDYGLKKLAEIFNRFKPIFLALKKYNNMSSIINKIAKLSKKYHKPIVEDYLNTITRKTTKYEPGKLEKKLSEANIFRCIRLAYALNYRLSNPESILYKIRNGKGYAKEFKYDLVENFINDFIYYDIKNHIVQRINDKVKDKKIYIPDYIEYALPTTEKQFVGNIPAGSCIKSSMEDFLLGIHWFNMNEDRIDLDLSMLSSNGKIGWDRNYYNHDRSVMFSGDITDAPKPNGASEFFYINRNNEEGYLLSINLFNHSTENIIPFTLIIGKEKVFDLERNYMVNPNNIVTKIECSVDKQQKYLGYLTTEDGVNKFYLDDIKMGKMRTSENTESSKHTQNYMKNYFKSIPTLNDILNLTDCILVKERDECDIDLSPESLEKDTIINLIR
jgi:hypothetical protein